MKFRVYLHSIHRFLGLSCGFIFAILCITGCIYMFRNEIEHLVDPDRYYIDNENLLSERYSLDELVIILERQNNARVESIFRPANPRRTYRFVLNTGTYGNRRLLLDVDPFTVKIKGQGPEKTGPFFRTIKKIHTTLGLPGKIGKWIVFGSTILFLPILLTGFYLWYPAGRFSMYTLLKNRLSIHFFSGKRRILFDLHNVLGFYLLLPMTIIIISGLFLAFTPHGKTVASYYHINNLNKNDRKSELFFPVSPLESIVTEHNINALGSDILLRIPYDKINQPFRLDSKKDSFFGCSIAKISYWNGTNGSFIGEDRFSDLSWKQKMFVLLCPLHYGDFLGTCSKIIYFMVCIFATSLPISGLCIFLR